MKRLILVLCIVLACTLDGYSPPIKTLIITMQMPFKPFLRLFNAVSAVESSNDSLAINHASNATGIVQITEILLKDYDTRAGKSYTLNDCFNIKISEEIFMFYASRYSPYQFETIARKWHGSGKETIAYWNKVKQHLK